MVRGTTPTLTLTLKGGPSDLAGAESVYVTIRQLGTVITKTGDALTVSGGVITCMLSQEESLSLREGTAVEIQVNWTYRDESGALRRAATRVKSVQVGRQLMPEVIA